MSEAVPGQTAEVTFRLIYRSRNRIPLERRKAALGNLFSAARSKNKKHQVSGALLVHDDTFVQTLEGAEPAVRMLYATIEQDSRHDSLSVLQAGPVGERVFSRWSMAEVADELGEPDVFLITHNGGISPAASLRTTPEQEAVLDFMRAAARGESKEPSPVLQSPHDGGDAERGVRVVSRNLA